MTKNTSKSSGLTGIPQKLIDRGQFQLKHNLKGDRADRLRGMPPNIWRTGGIAPANLFANYAAKTS